LLKLTSPPWIITMKKTHKQLFEILIKFLDVKSWDFMGWKEKMVYWRVGNYSASDLLSLMILCDFDSKEIIYDLATILGQEEVRKLVFGEEILDIEELGFEAITDKTKTVSFKFHSLAMILTGNPIDWLKYAIRFIEGKK